MSPGKGRVAIASSRSATRLSCGLPPLARKPRRLFVLQDVRIHLDRVEGLGGFIEFEAVAPPGGTDLARYEARLTDLRNSFGIADADLVGASYCDLVLDGSGSVDSSG